MQAENKPINDICNIKLGKKYFFKTVQSPSTQSEHINRYSFGFSGFGLWLLGTENKKAARYLHRLFWQRDSSFLSTVIIMLGFPFHLIVGACKFHQLAHALLPTQVHITHKNDGKPLPEAQLHLLTDAKRTKKPQLQTIKTLFKIYKW